MGFLRQIYPSEYKTGKDLTRDMIGIGMLLAGEGSRDPNIENTLVAASIEGLASDYRVLAILTDWLDIHFRIINADRLIRLVENVNDDLLKLYWQAVSQWKSNDNRFAKWRKNLRPKGTEKRVPLLAQQSDFQLKKYGEDERFAKTNLVIPKNFLRIRPKDIAPPEYIAKHHLAYRYRLIIGPTYRADLWATLMRLGDLTPTELAKRTYSSIASAWEVKKNWQLLKSKRVRTNI